MRRESAEVAAAAQRRLQQLGRQLGRAELEPAPSQRIVVPAPGRHARLDRSPVLRSRFSLSPAQLGVVAVLVVVVLAVTTWSVLGSAPKATTVPVAHTTPTVREDGAGAGPTAVPSSPAAQVVIDVVGKVRHPGVARLPVGSRVIDALRHAGGARPGADLSGLNLARLLVDGEQVAVGRPPAPGAPAGQPAVSGTSGASGAQVNLNTASAADLETLPGVGPVTAAKIVDWRTAHGAFAAVDELLEVDGIGDKTLAELAPHVTV